MNTETYLPIIYMFAILGVASIFLLIAHVFESRIEKVIYPILRERFGYFSKDEISNIRTRLASLEYRIKHDDALNKGKIMNILHQALESNDLTLGTKTEIKAIFQRELDINK